MIHYRAFAVLSMEIGSLTKRNISEREYADAA